MSTTGSHLKIAAPAPSFEIAGGSIAGRNHVAAGRNNQDAFSWVQTDAGLVAVVCDGCGSAAHSEVGANIGARLVVRAVLEGLREGSDPSTLLERARREVIARLQTLAAAMSVEAYPDRRPGPRGAIAAAEPRGAAAGYSQTVAQHFLFTVVGVLIADGLVTTFALGDGLVITNGKRLVLGPYANDEPPYLGYDLLSTGKPARGFDVHPSVPAAEVDSLLLGTDGVLELVAAGEEEPRHPGAPDALGAFWKDDRFFRNADMVRRRLVQLSRGAGAVAGEGGSHLGVSRSGAEDVPMRLRQVSPSGRLSDDTTLVVIRQRGGAYARGNGAEMIEGASS